MTVPFFGVSATSAALKAAARSSAFANVGLLLGAAAFFFGADFLAGAFFFGAAFLLVFLDGFFDVM